jgi:hypothetical protein
MVGRNEIKHKVHYMDIEVEASSGASFMIRNIMIACPDCDSENTRENGMKKRKGTRVQGFICANEHCQDIKVEKAIEMEKSRVAYTNHANDGGAGPIKDDGAIALDESFTEAINKTRSKNPRQFVAHTSKWVQDMVDREVECMISQLYLEGAKGKTVAKQHGVSDTFISFLRDEVERTITAGYVRDVLVDEPTSDRSVSVDEMFFKIGGKTIYVIIFRGYKTRKVLGLNFSETRKAKDMRNAFDEAQVNTKDDIKVITADAWGATRKMIREIGYDITLIIHKHKKPYDKIVIEYIQHINGDVVVTQVGTKDDIFTKRKKREFFYHQYTEKPKTTKKKKRGRPKGSKNKPKSPGRKKTTKKRGRRGLFKVFNAGTKGYVKVFPGRKMLKFSTTIPPEVVSCMMDAFELFAGMHIQNNCGEVINSVLRKILSLNGNRDVEKFSCRVRTFFIIRNRGNIIKPIMLNHRYRANIFLNKHLSSYFSNQLSKMNVNITAKEGVAC